MGRDSTEFGASCLISSPRHSQFYRATGQIVAEELHVACCRKPVAQIIWGWQSACHLPVVTTRKQESKSGHEDYSYTGSSFVSSSALGLGWVQE